MQAWCTHMASHMLIISSANVSHEIIIHWQLLLTEQDSFCAIHLVSSDMGSPSLVLAMGLSSPRISFQSPTFSYEGTKGIAQVPSLDIYRLLPQADWQCRQCNCCPARLSKLQRGAKTSWCREHWDLQPLLQTSHCSYNHWLSPLQPWFELG